MANMSLGEMSSILNYEKVTSSTFIEIIKNSQDIELMDGVMLFLTTVDRMLLILAEINPGSTCSMFLETPIHQSDTPKMTLKMTCMDGTLVGDF